MSVKLKEEECKCLVCVVLRLENEGLLCIYGNIKAVLLLLGLDL